MSRKPNRLVKDGTKWQDFIHRLREETKDDEYLELDDACTLYDGPRDSAMMYLRHFAQKGWVVLSGRWVRAPFKTPIRTALEDLETRHKAIVSQATLIADAIAALTRIA